MYIIVSSSVVYRLQAVCCVQVASSVLCTGSKQCVVAIDV